MRLAPDFPATATENPRSTPSTAQDLTRKFQL
jgi:hypothetical protein